MKYVNDGTVDGPNNIWVKFTWTPAGGFPTLTMEVSDNNKIQQYWYGDNLPDAGSGYANIHGNVETVGTTPDINYAATAAADDEYTFDITATFKGANDLLARQNAVTISSAFSGLLVDNRFEFKDGHGFYIFLGDATHNGGHFDNLGQLVATGNPTGDLDGDGIKEDLTTVDPFQSYGAVTGNSYYGLALYDNRWEVRNAAGAVVGYNYGNLIAVMTPDGKVTYAANRKAELLLNAYDHADLPNTVTAKVGIYTEFCLNPLFQEPTNNEFDVKFLRPISLTESSATFEDAETLGSDAPLVLSFKDWRDHSFTDWSKTKGQNYWAYYSGLRQGGQMKIKVYMNRATTDINGGDVNSDLLSNYRKVDLKYYPANSAAAGDYQPTAATNGVEYNIYATPTWNASHAWTGVTNYGKFHYENNGMTVGAFNVKVPAAIVYDWGEVPVTITCTFKKTQANARQH